MTTANKTRELLANDKFRTTMFKYFDTADEDGDQVLTKTEVKKYCTNLQKQTGASDQKVSPLVAKVEEFCQLIGFPDDSSDSKAGIKRADFPTLLAKFIPEELQRKDNNEKMKTKELCDEYFKAIDVDNSKDLEVDELKRSLSAVGGKKVEQRLFLKPPTQMVTD